MSFGDGVLATGMASLLETFSVAGAVALKAPNMLIAPMGALPGLLGAFGQLLLLRFSEGRRGHRFYVVRGVTFQCFFLFAAALAGFAPLSIAAFLYFAAIVGAQTSGQVMGGYWSSWMSDLVPPEVRGRHFAWRLRWFNLSSLVCSLSAGLLAREYASPASPWSVFCAVFTAALLLRLISRRLISRQYDPAVDDPPRHPEAPKPPLLSFRPSRDFLFYSVCMAFFLGSAGMSGPFFTVWYLRDLHFDYLLLSFITCCMGLGSLIALPFWGKAADRFGNARVLRLCGFLVCFNPLPYFFFQTPAAALFVSLYNGVTWAGFNLVNFNYMIGLTAPERRIPSFAVSAVIGSVVGVLMSLLGGFLSTRLPNWFGWQLQSLFLLSMVLRFTIWASTFHRFRHEGGAKEDLGARVLLRELPGFRYGEDRVRDLYRAGEGFWRGTRNRLWKGEE